MATVRFRLEKREHREYSIMARFTLNASDRFAISTGERIDPKYWDNQLQQVKPTHPDHVSLNVFLSKFKANLLTLYRDNHGISFEDFKALAKNKPVQKKSLLSLFPEFLQEVKRTRSHRTWLCMNTLWGHLQKIQLSDNPEGIKRSLEDRFYSTKWGKKEGLSDTTVFKYINDLKSYFKWAESKGITIGQMHWKSIRRISDPLTLTMHDLYSLESLVFKSPHTGVAIARDYLVVGARVGMRISDLKKINRNSLMQDQSGKYFLSFSPTKRKRLNPKTITIPMVGYMEGALKVLQKHNFKLPDVVEPTLNAWIKKVCRLAGITQEVTRTRWVGTKEITETRPKCEWLSSHTGRKTFITLSLEQGVSPKIVMAIAGISSWRTLAHYEAQSQAETIANEYLRVEKLKAS